MTVRAILENPKEELLSGMYVKIRLPYKVVKDALLIPEASIGTGQAGRYVYLVDENNRVVQQTVKVGDRQWCHSGRPLCRGSPDECASGHDRETSERKNKTLIYSYVQYIFH